MNSILKIFKPAPYIQPIEDQEEVKKLYHYWRIRILYSMFVGYALYYFTRFSFTFAMPGLIEDLGFDKSQLGMLASIFAITYGISKFASGILSDQCNSRYFMAFGLIMTGVFNIFFGMASSLMMFAVCWGFNGWFQGFGAPPCSRFLTHWYSHGERGSWWSTWNLSHNVGAFLIPWIVGAALQFFGWRYAMYIPGVICIAGGFYLANRLRDTPQSLGLPSIEEFRNDYGGFPYTGKQEVQLSTKEILVEYILKNPYLWMLGFAYIFIYVVRNGVNNWTVLFLREEKGYSLLGANGCMSLFELGGVIGNLCAGWASDYLFQAKRGPINALFALGVLLSMIFFWFIPPGYPWLDTLAVFMIGFSIFGPQLMIGMAAVELSHKKAASTTTGFVGVFAYLGAAIAGYPLGKVTQDWGWEGFFWFIVICSAIAFVLLLPLWSITAGPKKVLATSTSTTT